jgi:peptide/nickel transport system permease protein
VEYISNLVRGDLGVSIFSTGTPVSDIIARFLPWTLFCVGLGLLLSFVVGLLLGMVMAYWRNSLLDTALTTVTSFLSSIPSYLIPLLLIYLVALQWRLIPVSQMRGAYDPNLTPAFTPTFILSVVRYATLPVLTYILSQVGHWALSMKNSTIGVLGEEYVNAAHARGLRRGRIMTAYVGRNAALPLFTQFALSLGTIFGGAILIELFFSYPGIGIRLYEAILRRDYPVMQGIFLMITITTIIANLLADFFYAQLDPRARRRLSELEDTLSDTNTAAQVPARGDRPYEVVQPFPVRSYDIDFAQIVSNIVYVRWLEDMRLIWLERYFPLRPQMERGIGPVLVATHVEYKRPVRFFDEVVGHLWLHELGRTRAVLRAEFVTNGEVSTTAEQTVVFVDFSTMRPIPLPEPQRSQFAAALGTG